MEKFQESSILAKNPLLHAIEEVAAALKDSHIATHNYIDLLQPLAPHLALITDQLGCNTDEAWLIAVYFSVSVQKKQVSPTDFMQYTACSPLFMLRLEPLLLGLIKARLLLEYAKKDIWADDESVSHLPDLFVPTYILQKVIHGKAIGERQSFEHVTQFLEKIAEVMESYRNSRFAPINLDQETAIMRQEAAHFPLVEYVLWLQLEVRDQLLLYLMLFNALIEQDEELSYYISSVESKFMRRSQLKQSFMSGRHPLIEKGLVEIRGGEFLRNNDLVLTPFAYHKLLGYTAPVHKPVVPKFTLLQAIPADTISPVTLYYPDAIQPSINTLKRYVSETNYIKIQRRLKAAQLPTGLTILLEGAPGTGKTALVRQLALRSNRMLLSVEMSQVKQKWVGETEKQVKQIFTEYKRALQFYDKAPILLLNEADALLTQRQTDTGGNGVRNMLNTMQNILLQELEDFNGILIATTNRFQDFDPAFERRFLYKVAIEAPDATARQKIWQALFPGIPPTIVKKLIDWPLTGGQISNIARKATIQQVLEGDQPELEQLTQLARQELGEASDRAVIGFRRVGAA